MRAFFGLLLLSVVAHAEPTSAVTVPEFTVTGKLVSKVAPQLPPSFASAHTGQSLRAVYRVCIATDGTIASTSVLASVGDAAADAALQKQLSDGLRFQAFDAPTCFAKPLVFRLANVDGSAPATPAPGQGMIAPDRAPSPDTEVVSTADGFLRALEAAELHAAYSTMAPGYRTRVTEAAFLERVSSDEAKAGKLIDARYARIRHSVQSGPVPGRNVWEVVYALRTTTTADWSHFIRINVELDPPLAISTWLITGYDPVGIPRAPGVPASAQDLSEPDGTVTVPMFTLVSQKISAPNPHLSDKFKSVHGHQQVVGSYKVCIETDGHVSRTRLLLSTGDTTEDERVMKQIRDSWLYKPQPISVCFVSRLVFQIP